MSLNQRPLSRSERCVLVVSSELPPGPGGIGAHALAVATEFHRQGRIVRLVGSQDYVTDQDRAAFAATTPFPVSLLPSLGDPVRTAIARFREIRRAIALHQPGVIIATGGRIQWLVAAATRKTSVPVVAVVHGSELGGSRWQQSLTRHSLERSTQIVAVSHFTANLATQLGIHSTPIKVVHNGADGNRFHPDPVARERFRKRFNVGDGPMVLTVGNVTERKGQHLTIAALPHLLEQLPDTRYVIVGRPTEGDAISSLAQDLGVADHVHLLGQLDAGDVTDAHAAADAFAMTSTATASGDVEGYGIAVVEAALSGVPAVVTRGTGAAEAVIDEVTGLVSSPDPRSIATALGRLLGPDGKVLGMAAEQRSRAIGTWTSRAQRYGEIVDEIVSDHRPRIVVVSHTDHYRRNDGTTVAFGPTTRELDHLASLASELVHVAPLYEGAPPRNALVPQAPNVRLVPVPPAGGPRQIDRLLALAVVPRWLWTINREIGRADVVHVRCPAGISMTALLVLLLRRHPRDRWVKYAGNWVPPKPDAFTYRFQRAWLRGGLARAVVTVNGRWAGQPPWVYAFDNPTLTDDELATGRSAAKTKDYRSPHRLVFAGRLEEEKGVPTVVDTLRHLQAEGLEVSADIVGDGPLRPWVEDQQATLVPGSLRVHGWLPRSELEAVLASGSAFLLPTASEGFPKVLAEAMAFGCVPIANDVSSIGQTLGETGGAVVMPPGASWPVEVSRLLREDRLAELAATGLDAVDRFSYSVYLRRVRSLPLSWLGEEPNDEMTRSSG